MGIKILIFSFLAHFCINMQENAKSFEKSIFQSYNIGVRINVFQKCVKSINFCRLRKCYTNLKFGTMFHRKLWVRSAWGHMTTNVRTFCKNAELHKNMQIRNKIKRTLNTCYLTRSNHNVLKFLKFQIKHSLSQLR